MTEIPHVCDDPVQNEPAADRWVLTEAITCAREASSSSLSDSAHPGEPTSYGGTMDYSWMYYTLVM